MRMGAPKCCFCSDMLARLSPDSACAKNPVATKTATQKINLAAFDIFIRVLVSLRASKPNLLHGNAADTLRFSDGILRRCVQKTQAECLNESFNGRDKKVTESLHCGTRGFLSRVRLVRARIACCPSLCDCRTWVIIAMNAIPHDHVTAS